MLAGEVVTCVLITAVVATMVDVGSSAVRLVVLVVALPVGLAVVVGAVAIDAAATAVAAATIHLAVVVAAK
eukprot:3146734-Pleurochrysis_carterae.AAC.1